MKKIFLFSIALLILGSTVFTSYGQLNGTYTIGGTTPDYATLTAAVSDITTVGVSGQVIFNIREGSYNEQISIGDITGVSAVNTVIFQPEGDVAVDIYYSNSSTRNYVVQFNGADYVTFTNIEFEATFSYYGRVFDIADGSNNISITDNTINGYNTTSDSDNLAVIYSSDETINNNILITNNNINYGSYAICLYGSSSNEETENEISNNIIQNFALYGIGVFYQDAINISLNTIGSMANVAIKHGIYAENCSNNCVFEKNQIAIKATSENYGIYLKDCNGTSGNESQLINNFVSCVSSTNISYGIYLQNDNYINSYFNSVHIMDGNNHNGRALFAEDGDNLQFKNNMFINSNGTNYPGYAIYTNSTTNITVSNNNNIYSKYIDINYTYTRLTYWGTKEYKTLAKWQNATLLDQNSVTVTPVFTAAFDLHSSSVACEGKGVPIAGITDDIDGEIRNETNPNIGADEYTTGITALAGTYTIGGTTPDYPTINDAITDLHNRGVSAQVIFNIREGTYDEQLVIGVIPWASETNNVIFQPEALADVTITTIPTGYGFLINLINTSFVTFKDLTLVHNGTAGVILNITKANNITLSGNLFDHLNSAISGMYSNESDIIIIDNNNFHNQGFGTGAGYGIYLANQSGEEGTGNVISNNTITCNYRAIYITNQDAINITGNETFSKSIGISLSSCINNCNILNNRIRLTADNDGFGIKFSNCSGTEENEIQITNNFVNTWSDDGGANGIYLSNSDYVKVYYNSINIRKAGSAMFNLNGNNVEVKNNIFKAKSGYAIFSNTPFDSDYNDLYNTGTFLGRMGFTDCADLAEWQTASSGDANSISADPEFFSGYDLHTYSTSLDGKGTPIATITTDIDGQTRDETMPDIGADEFSTSPLSGIYTIGKSNADFSSLEMANMALDILGVDGEVIFNINPGTYTEQIIINEVTGASEVNTITFQAENPEDVNITYSSSHSSLNFIIKFDGANYITFKNLTFTATGSNYGKVFLLYQNSNNNTLEGNIINGKDLTGESEYNFYAIHSSNNSNLSIINNTINNGSFAIYLEDNNSSGNYINNNILNNFYHVGIHAKYQDAVVITNNEITGKQHTSTIFQRGIVMGFSDNASIISKNIIKTHVKNQYGIYILGSDGTLGNEIKISNNFIYSYNELIISSYGIYSANNNYVKIYNNSVFMTAGASNVNPLFIDTNSEHIELINNIFANTSGVGYAINIQNAASVTVCDNNNLYTTGTNLGSWASSDYTDLAAWQTASSLDANSISADPEFTSETDLHIPMTSPCNATGAVLADITDDIDGELRNPSTPDIGADEATCAPLVTTQPEANTTTCENEPNITLEVITSSEGSINYQWYFEGSEIGGATNSTYVVTTNPTNSGTYTCSASGECGEYLTTNDAVVTINPETEITTQPTANTTICEGETDITLEVIATGYNLTYQWYLESSEISGATNSSYTVATAPANSGSYTCTVSGNCGILTTNEAIVTINPTTEITTQPTANTIICEGETDINLEVIANGSNLSYQWYFEGTEIGGATNSTYAVITNPTNSGTYTCTISGDCESLITNNAVVLINYATTITTQPTENSTVCVGSNDIELNVIAEGTNLSYQWFKDNVEIDLETTYSITITTVEINSGTYTCSISGTCGSLTTIDAIVFIGDDTAPVPDVANIDVTEECSVDLSTYTPTATDNCAGSINGTTSDPLEYTEQGTYIITWSYDDENGNIETQEQNVIIEDVTNPTIECVNNQEFTLMDGETVYTISGTDFDATADDNCNIASLVNDWTTTATLDASEFPVGITTVVWTVTDIAGNSEICTFDVQINAFVGISDLSELEISIYPNPTTGIFTITNYELQITNVEIRDITGKTIYHTTMAHAPLQIDITNQASGIYFIKFQNNEIVKTLKIIKE